MLLIGCSSIKYIPAYKSLTIIDFSKYAKEGFLITPEPYNYEFQSMGIIHFVIRPPAFKRSIRTKSNTRQFIWEAKDLKVEKVLDYAIKKAKELGGDAIMNFKLVSNDKSFLDNGRPYKISGFEVYGFIIKRLNNKEAQPDSIIDVIEKQ